MESGRYPPARARSIDRLFAKLSNHAALDRADRDAIERAFGRDVRLLEAGIPIVEAGEAPRAIHVLLDGWAVREFELATGRRQIVSILMAGDVVDFNAFMMASADARVRTVGNACVASIDRAALSRLNQDSPRVGQALWWEAMVSASIQREWSANIAARRAEPRIANLLCTLLARAMLVDMAQDDRIECPLTQGDLANACGVTQEHLNRTLRGLRAQGVVAVQSGTIVITDPRRLAEIASFSPAHLHCPARALSFAPAPEPDTGRMEEMTMSFASVI